MVGFLYNPLYHTIPVENLIVNYSLLSYWPEIGNKNHVSFFKYSESNLDLHISIVIFEQSN